MTQEKQPEALRLAGLLDYELEECSLALIAAAELRRLHAENQALQSGYDAARLEVESLQSCLIKVNEQHRKWFAYAQELKAQLAAVGAGGVESLAVAHPDDAAVDALAVLMKAKLTKQRKKGYGGWETPRCTQYHLSILLRDHVDKGDPVDVANFCAFLSARGEGIASQPPVVIPLEHDEDWLEQMYWEFDESRQKSGDERLRFKGFMRAYGAKCANGLANLAQMEPDEGGAA